MNSNAKEIEELSDGWVRCKSKSNPGRQYFFNRKTGKSSWTQPEPGEKQDILTKKKKYPKLVQKSPAQDRRNKSSKRKSNESEAGSSKKRLKNETPQKPTKKVTPKTSEKSKPTTKNKSPSKRLSFNDSKFTTPPKKVSPSKVSPSKNSASKRLSQLRAQLNSEAREENNDTPQKKVKTNSKSDTYETVVRPASEPSSNVNDSSGTATKSPNESLHTIPSPSQFFAANKIISSMKAQLPDEFQNKEKPKDTFADIEHGICYQMTDYPVIKHPATPPQFSEASKLVSAIKSKLNYTPKDVKTFSSAKDRMEALRASISGEINEQDLNDSNNDSFTLHASQFVAPNVPRTPEKCEAMEVEEIKEAIEVPKAIFPSKDRDIENGQVVLVVDTNIFIHELNFIKNVLDSYIEGYSEKPMLLVPWRVINELDRLKDNNNGNGALCKRARAAMDYLYKSLPENNQIKGQSLRDANSHIYPCELPDDEILNCALQQAERGKNVLLLSNDRNLCNKATVNGIRRLALEELRPLLQRRELPASVDSVAHCRRTVCRLLATILENEMRAKYNNLWLHVLFKAPPWRLIDVLKCLLKHWIAVFNEVFPRIEHLITELKNMLERIEGKDPKSLTESEVTQFKELCLDIARKCQIIPEYMELAKLTAARLMRGASETDDERARQTVVAAFEGVWLVAASYCAKLATALGVAHSVEDTIPVAETLMNLTSKFGDFNGSITNFILTIEGVLNIEDTSSMDEKIARLEAAFRECLQLTRHEGRPSKEELRTFCLTNRNMLQEAVSKFSQLSQLLDVCKSKLEPSV